MAAHIVSNTLVGTTIVVQVCQNWDAGNLVCLDTTPLPSFAYPATPPDGRSAGQWQTDCGAAALALVGDPALGDGGPDATQAADSMEVTG